MFGFCFVSETLCDIYTRRQDLQTFSHVLLPTPPCQGTVCRCNYRKNRLQKLFYDNYFCFPLFNRAAEARNRIRLTRLRYQNNRRSEVNHLISCQPTALKAVRLQSLVPPSQEKIHIRDLLVKNERCRVNSLLEDETGLETARILT
ncbi:PREDICTED: uncharacterized protein LOC107330123 [Acropora digitifera]|uniref:uncharacterized protein LOC107330123 n=1 Tax=Acropora digitifera TaxID=70779 RepID=UPI00077AAB3A|nr:PREDICTED: uncharacterized protein LOC107330123 [Acropora digitifera]